MEEQEREARFNRTVFNQFMDLYISPEIAERKQKGRLGIGFSLRAAQIVFFPDGRRPEVRINSEVKAIGKVKLKAGVTKKTGEPIYDNEVVGLNQINLTDEDDPDSGHATLVRVGDSWIIAFDFRYNKELSRKHIELARQFYESAKSAFNQSLWAPFADNLFSAAELSAKSVLLSMPDPKFRKRATHRAIQTRYNRFANLGNAKPIYKDTLNKLSGLRDCARYMKGRFQLTESKAREFLESVNRMIEDAAHRIEVAQ